MVTTSLSLRIIRALGPQHSGTVTPNNRMHLPSRSQRRPNPDSISMLQYGQDCVAAYVSAEVSLCSGPVETALEHPAKAVLVARSPALLAELGARIITFD